MGSEEEVYKVMQAGSASRSTSATSKLSLSLFSKADGSYERAILSISFDLRNWDSSTKYRERKSEVRKSVPRRFGWF